MINIHETPEQKLARNTQTTAGAVAAVLDEVRGIHEVVDSIKTETKNKSELITGFTGVLKAIQNNTEATRELSNAKVIQKLEEVKSAGLIANQLLKKIEKSIAREPEKFPKIEIPEVDFSETNKLLTKLVEQISKDQEVEVVLEIE